MFKTIWYIFMSVLLSWYIIYYTYNRLKNPIDHINYDDFAEETQLKIKSFLTKQNKIFNVMKAINIVFILSICFAMFYFSIMYKNFVPMIPLYINILISIICEIKLGFFKFKKRVEEK